MLSLWRVKVLQFKSQIFSNKQNYSEVTMSFVSSMLDSICQQPRAVQRLCIQRVNFRNANKAKIVRSNILKFFGIFQLFRHHLHNSNWLFSFRHAASLYSDSLKFASQFCINYYAEFKSCALQFAFDFGSFHDRIDEIVTQLEWWKKITSSSSGVVRKGGGRSKICGNQTDKFQSNQ